MYPKVHARCRLRGDGPSRPEPLGALRQGYLPLDGGLLEARGAGEAEVLQPSSARCGGRGEKARWPVMASPPVRVFTSFVALVGVDALNESHMLHRAVVGRPRCPRGPRVVAAIRRAFATLFILNIGSVAGSSSPRPSGARRRSRGAGLVRSRSPSRRASAARAGIRRLAPRTLSFFDVRQRRLVTISGLPDPVPPHAVARVCKDRSVEPGP